MNESRLPDQSAPAPQNLRMPPIPRVLPKILDHLHASGFANKEAVLEAMQCSPGLEERVLKRVNSQMRRPVDTLGRAIELIGPTTAAGIVIGLSMNKLTKLQRGPAGTCLRRLIQHSEGTAILARHLLDRCPQKETKRTNDLEEEESTQSAFAKGFAHDLGKLVLICNYPEKAAALYGDEWTDRGPEGADERALERYTFGIDHVEAGARAVDEMDLPTGLATTVKHHHDASASPPDVPDVWDLRAVRAANLATRALGADFSGLYALDVSLDWETCAEHPIWYHWQTESTDSRPEAIVQDLLVQEGFILYSKFFLDLPDVQNLSP